MCIERFKGFHMCTDIDECALGIHECAESAFCINTLGSYRCICKEKYFGNGTVCFSKCYPKDTFKFII